MVEHSFAEGADCCVHCGMTAREVEGWADVSCDAAKQARLGSLRPDIRAAVLADLDVAGADAPPVVTAQETVATLVASVRKEFRTEDERLAYLAERVLALGNEAALQRNFWDAAKADLDAEVTAWRAECERLKRSLVLRNASPLALCNDLFAAHLLRGASRPSDAKDEPPTLVSMLTFATTEAMRQAGAEALAGYSGEVASRAEWADRVYQAMARAAVATFQTMRFPAADGPKLLGTTAGNGEVR